MNDLQDVKYLNFYCCSGFWEAIDRVKDDQLVDDKAAGAEQSKKHLQQATELSVWLHTEYQCKMEEADKLLECACADETKPYEEKYKARELLNFLRENEYLSDKYTKLPEDDKDEENVTDGDSVRSQSQGSAVMRCALGLIMHKLGVNYYETEEMKDSLACLLKSLKLMDSIPD